MPSPDLSTLTLSASPTTPSDAVETIQNIASHVSPPQIPPHRSHDPSNNLKRSDPFQFGSRYLEEGDDVYEFNAWDHVETDSVYKEYAELQYARQREAPVSDFDKKRFNSDPAKWWNLFYRNNTSNFFKNRKWLQQEFPVLTEVTREGAGRKVLLEVGAGAGNTAFPILKANENEGLMIHACDFSKKAVGLMEANEAYDEKFIRAEVWDIASETETLPPGLEAGSVDVVLLIFIFSALSPAQWRQAVRNVSRALKPGGEVCFRDYGRGDLAQVRFKKGRYMVDNFYVRGDGTRVYFFEKEELEGIWGGGLMGWDDDEIEESQQASVDDEAGSGVVNHRARIDTSFEILSLGVDRRLLVNRQRKLKMYRCWMQGRFRKRDDAKQEIQSNAQASRSASAAEYPQRNEASGQS
ncbi:hypothetical protein MMC08_008409 [Hypocenomyce scalaris]|nr:hypothetical protein [Hypocenomyce scalaris]